MTATPFQLESLNYQTDAVDAVVRVFDGTPKTQVHELAGTREDVAFEFALRIDELQHRGQGYRDGRVFNQWGICYVRNPYGAGAQ